MTNKKNNDSIDEPFMEEMLTYIRDFHIKNGCDEELAKILGFYNVYKLRTMHHKKDRITNIRISQELRKIMMKYKKSNWELITALYRELGRGGKTKSRTNSNYEYLHGGWRNCISFNSRLINLDVLLI